ncbi:hypothetical protein VX159_09335 [Dechloromonas sp. ZY10]|uniref:hypothetical protein n=1 Tax=Dechloromonas aquae TaxID=2664436 RepID=UPI003528DEF4
MPKLPIFPATLYFLAGGLPVACAAESAVHLPEVEVYGHGEFRQVQSWRPPVDAPVAAGETPLKSLNRLAGVNFQAADPFGSYEWATRISLRGFSAAQLGFTLDDMPLGEMYYSTLNGLSINRALIGENLGRIRISQGSGALETAATSNLGGTLQFYSQDPAERAGGQLAQTLGSHGSQRTWLRADSGRLANDGKFYVAAAHQSTDLWKGSGHQSQDQVNLKYTQVFDDRHLSLYYNFSDRQEMDYQDLTKAWIDQLGYRWSNYWPNLPAAIANAANTGASGVPVNGGQTVANPVDAAYYAAAGVRRDHFAYATLQGATGQQGEWKASVYAHDYRGASIWYTPHRATPGASGSPLSERVLAYDSQRVGGLASLSGSWGAHQLSTGFWYEYLEATQKRLFFPVDRSGPAWSPYRFPDPDSAFFTQWAYRFNTQTLQYHLQDVWQLNEQFSLLAGFKSSYSRSEGRPTVDRLGGLALPQGSLTAQDGFLPQLGAKWSLGGRSELFFDLSKTLRSYQLGGYGIGQSPWAVRNQAAFDLAKAQLNPETAWTYEAGYRFAGELAAGPLRGYQGAVSFYHVRFSDRLLNISPGGSLLAATSGAAVLANVGGVTMNGIEVAGALRFARGWRWQQSLSYTRATYDDDYFSNQERIAIAGKTVVDTPRWLYKSELAYRHGPYQLHLQADYQSARFYTYGNDQSVPGRWLFNLGGGVELGRWGGLGEAGLRLDVLNLFDRKYVSTVGTSGYTASGDYQTLQVGLPRQVFVTLKLAL